MAKMRFWTSPRLLYPLIILLLAGLLACSYFYFLRAVTTVILVRHAEKNIDPDNPNPDLSPEGRARAKELVHILGGTVSRQFMQLSMGALSIQCSRSRSVCHFQ